MTNIRRDTTDPEDNKLRRAADLVEQGYDDRFPARGRARTSSGDHCPLDQVSREGKLTPYRK
jgi:hypothetical protein